MKFWPYLGLFLFPTTAFSQTSLSGTINAYAEVTHIDYCNSSLSVDDAAVFSPGDRVLLIQMQGAILQSSNNASFGSILDIQSAGWCEWNSVRAVNQQIIVLENAILNTYQPGLGLQLVRVPRLSSATVTQGLTASAWNGVKGGVLALEVEQQLTLQANIQVNGKGFRGGSAGAISANNCSWLLPQNGYVFSANSWRGAPKGEGIAPFLSGLESGRGAWSTGGGGGNDHNSGGGGGGHIASGGRGGTNEEPSNFGCQGNFPGIGGYSLPADSNRLFLGGGGGAGHENNQLGSSGGNGGGIIIIRAKNIVGNGFSITANGMDAAESLSDGAGGGGAGGSILLVADSIFQTNIEAKGGKGGDAFNANGPRCMGPGGGGAGGRIVIPTAYMLSSTAVAGGLPGQSVQSASCADSSNGAQPGAPGIIQHQPEDLPESNIPNPPLPEAEFTLNSNGFQVQFTNQSLRASTFQWNFGDGNVSAMQNPVHTFPGPGNYQVRLIALNSCGSDTLTLPIQFGQIPQAAFSQSISTGCAPLPVQFQNQSTGDFQQILWNFPGGIPETSTSANPTVIYPNPGVYDVTLSVFNPGDTSVAMTENAVVVTPFPEPSFTYEIQGLTVQFENTSENATSYTWLFGDGQSSQQESPIHQYTTPGVYSVTLNAQQPLCAASTSATLNLLASTVTNDALSRMLEISPNPATDRLMLRWKDTPSESTRFQLWHTSGILCQSGEFYLDALVMIQNLPTGLYFLKISQGENNFSRKIVVRKN